MPTHGYLAGKTPLILGCDRSVPEKGLSRSEWLSEPYRATAVVEAQDRHYFSIAFMEVTTIESDMVHAFLTGRGALGTRDA